MYTRRNVMLCALKLFGFAWFDLLFTFWLLHTPRPRPLAAYNELMLGQNGVHERFFSLRRVLIAFSLLTGAHSTMCVVLQRHMRHTHLTWHHQQWFEINAYSLKGSNVSEYTYTHTVWHNNADYRTLRVHLWRQYGMCSSYICIIATLLCLIVSCTMCVASIAVDIESFESAGMRQ